MKFNNDNNTEHNLEIDDMNIKSSLNTSLDLSGINVSEALINRTLEAIKQQPVVQNLNQTSAEDKAKKVVAWNRNIRTFAGVAAAVLIVVIGASAVSTMDFGKSMSKSDNMATTDEPIRYEEAAQEAPESSSFSAKMEAAATEEAAPAQDMVTEDVNDNSIMAESELKYATEDAVQFTITADELRISEDTEAGSEGMQNREETEEPKPKLAAELNGSELAVFTFRDIFLPVPENAEYVMITDEIKNASITLTNQDDILKFYLLMDQYQFTSGAEDLADQNYTVEVKTPQPEEARYTLIVGDGITVRYATGDLFSQSIYSVIDEELLKQSLEQFFIEYSN